MIEIYEYSDTILEYHVISQNVSSNTLTKDIDDNIQNAYITTREDVEQTFHHPLMNNQHAL